MISSRSNPGSYTTLEKEHKFNKIKEERMNYLVVRVKAAAIEKVFTMNPVARFIAYTTPDFSSV